MTVVIRTFIACRRAYLFFAYVTLCLYPSCAGGVLFLAVQGKLVCHLVSCLSDIHFQLPRSCSCSLLDSESRIYAVEMTNLYSARPVCLMDVTIFISSWISQSLVACDT
jgi:hypothetical protein